MGNKALGKKRNFDNNPPPETQLPSVSQSRKSFWKNRFDTKETNTKSNFFGTLISKFSRKSSTQPSSKSKRVAFSSSATVLNKDSSGIIDKGGGPRDQVTTRDSSSRSILRRKLLEVQQSSSSKDQSQLSSQIIQIYPKKIKRNPLLTPVQSIDDNIAITSVRSTKVLSSQDLSNIYESPSPAPPCIELEEPGIKRKHRIKKSEKALLEKLHEMLSSSEEVKITKDDLLETINNHRKESLNEEKPEPNLREFLEENQAKSQPLPEIFDDAEKNLISKQRLEKNKGSVSMNSNESTSGTTSTTTSSSKSTATTSSSKSSNKRKGSKRKTSKSRANSKNKVKGKVLTQISFSTDEIHVDGKIVMDKVVKKAAGADEFFLYFD